MPYTTLTVALPLDTWMFSDGPRRQRDTLLALAFPELPDSAAGDMLGELPPGFRSRNRAAGPLLTELPED